MDYKPGKNISQVSFLADYLQKRAAKGKKAEPSLINKEYLESFQLRSDINAYAPDQPPIFLGTTVGNGVVYAAFGTPSQSLNQKGELLDHTWKDYKTLSEEIKNGTMRGIDPHEALGDVFVRSVEIEKIQEAKFADVVEKAKAIIQAHKSETPPASKAVSKSKERVATRRSLAPRTP